MGVGAGTGTATTAGAGVGEAGTLTTVGFSQAANVKAASMVESKIEYFMVSPLEVEKRDADSFNSSGEVPGGTLAVVVGTTTS